MITLYFLFLKKNNSFFNKIVRNRGKFILFFPKDQQDFRIDEISNYRELERIQREKEYVSADTERFLLHL